MRPKLGSSGVVVVDVDKQRQEVVVKLVVAVGARSRRSACAIAVGRQGTSGGNAVLCYRLLRANRHRSSSSSHPSRDLCRRLRCRRRPRPMEHPLLPRRR